MKTCTNLHAITALTLGVGVLAAISARGQTQLIKLDGVAGEHYGTALADAGDIDGDGVNDLLVGAPNYAANQGRVLALSGRTFQPNYTLLGAAAGDYFGHAVAALGDVDLDGVGDFAVGAPGASWANVWSNSVTSPGYVRVCSGASGALLYTRAGPLPDSRMGWSLAGGGDANGDGVPDLLVGAPGYTLDANTSRPGRAYLLDGPSGNTIRRHDGSMHYLSNDACGFAVAFLGDLDSDGMDEYAASLPEPDQSATNPAYGRVRAWKGATGDLMWEKSGTSQGGQLGWSLTTIGDLNGNSDGELLIGAHHNGCLPCSGYGRVHVVQRSNGVLLTQISGVGPYSSFGASTVVLGDLDGDGLDDFAASAPASYPGNTTFPFERPPRVIAGSSFSDLLTIPASNPYGAFGFALASADFNGDGLRDLALSAPFEDDNGTDSGSVWIYTIVRVPIVYCDAEHNSLGCTPAMSSIGAASATSASVFDVRATNVLNNKSGLLFYSFKPRETPFQGGHMCVVAQTQRTPVQSSGGTAPPASDCSGVFTLDFNARIQSGVDPLLIAGEEVFAQYWSRDPADLSTTNLTDALAFYINP